MGTRDDLIRAMNPPGKQAWSPEAQELNLLLHDLATNPPEGWKVSYELCNDDDERHPTNCATFQRERTYAWREHLTRRHAKYGDDDDLADRDAIPSDGHHVLIVLKHRESGAEVRRWVDRESLMLTVRLKNRSAAQKRVAIHQHIDAAIADAAPRVARKQALKADGKGRPGR